MDADAGRGLERPFPTEFARHAVAAFGGLIISGALHAWVRPEVGAAAAGAVWAIVAWPLVAALLVYTAAMQSVTARWQAFAWSPLIAVVTLSPPAMFGQFRGPRELLATAALVIPALVTAAIAQPQRMEGQDFGPRVGPIVCIGLLLGAATAGLAAALGTLDDGWRVDVYFAVSGLSGLYPGWAARGRRAAAGGSLALGQYLAAAAYASPALRNSEGFALMWPLVVVPAGVAVMAAVAAATARLRARRRR